jgi:hypothetical protein
VQKVSAVVLVVVSLLASVARAEDPCASDVVKFCPKVQGGAGRISRCLEDHESKLAPACSARLETDKQRAKVLMAQFADSCGEDVKQLCPGVSPGGGRLLKCLTQNDYAVSPSCQVQLTRLDNARATVQAVKTNCEADVKRLCPTSTGHPGELITCLRANPDALSAECKASNPASAIEAVELADTVEEVTSQARLEDTIEILQGLNSVAFSRNQLALSFDYFQGLAGKPFNADELTFNPLLVFGHKNEFAVQLKVPVAALFPTVQGPSAVSGIADINTAFAWAFYAKGSIRQYAAVGLQWNSASVAAVGAPWVVAPVYAIAAGLTPWMSLTVELTWNHSFGTLGTYPGVNLLVLRPILAFNLPSAAFVAVDTKLGWDFIHHIFVPIMKFQAGKIIGRERNVSIAAWYQITLNTVGRQDSFNYGVGLSLSYFFDW